MGNAPSEDETSERTVSYDCVELEFYLWPSSIVNDHVALRINDIGLYISWCPKHGIKARDSSGSKSGANNILDCESAPRTLDQDYQAESGRTPRKTVTLKITRDKANRIKAWWDAYKRRRENYKLHKNNCCHIVLKALAAAFSDFNTLKTDEFFLCPGRVADLIEKLREQHEELKDGDVDALKEVEEKKRRFRYELL